MFDKLRLLTDTARLSDGENLVTLAQDTLLGLQQQARRLVGKWGGVLFWLRWNYDMWPACKCWPSRGVWGMLPQE